MDLKIRDKKVPVEDLELKIRNALNKGLSINWELFWQIKHHGGCDHPAYKKVIDLFLHFDILSLKQDGNIVLRFPDATNSQSIGNPRHYLISDVECGYNPLFFRREQDATEYVKTGEEVGYLFKGYQAQRIHVVK